ncbi:hypothetical protein [Candidatus Similichlamydia epinepheli]|uniref:hypothetical protein n=1 Tax=Candidatus Similichlamydia epinepheli TaxID=1903953 RepID=UPI000D34FEF2|nr:hypothetical protein [Candidatus Similichlamydia epinepheli]
MKRESRIQFFTDSDLGLFEVAPKHPEFSDLWKKLEKALPSVSSEEKAFAFFGMVTDWIVSVPHPAFLLPSILTLFRNANASNLLDRTIHFLDWEQWILFYGNFSKNDEIDLRAKIVGKKSSRESYQTYFPIGHGLFYRGSHYVSAHKSPDLDTLVCSFWGWMDAFGAKISDRLHIWHVPDGKINPTDLAFLDSLLGIGNFDILCRRRESLEAEACDLSSPCAKCSSANDLLREASNHKSLLVVNENGQYLGEWNAEDSEMFYSIVMPLTHLLDSFESQIRSSLFDCFSRESPNEELQKLLWSFENKIVAEDVTFLRYSDLSKSRLKTLFESVFSFSIFETIKSMSFALKKNGICELTQCFEAIEKLLAFDFSKKTLFSVFIEIKTALQTLEKLSENCFAFLRKGSSALLLKRNLWCSEPRWVTPQATFSKLTELFQKDHSPISLIISNNKNQLIPIGCIESERVQSSKVGTVSLRDFSNRSEARIATHLDIISVIDHHKTFIETSAPSSSCTADVQACSVLLHELEELSFRIQDQEDDATYVHPDRRFIFSFSLLASIFDDTDLLVKAKRRDCLAVRDLIEQFSGSPIQWEKGRSLADLKQQLLTEPSAFSIYSKFFDLRKKNLEKALHCAAKFESFELFTDTKVQGAGVLVGQSKLFLTNWANLKQLRPLIIQQWLHFCEGKNSEAHFFCHLMSTILSAEQVMKGKQHPEDHKDQLWIAGRSKKRINLFLKSLLENETALKETEIEFINGDALTDKFPALLSCKKTTQKSIEEIDRDILIMHFPAGSLNSRKSSLTPHIPNI